MTAPLYQLLPDLNASDYERLRADIAQRGVLVPVEVDEDGVLLDGHNRSRIAAELGIDCPTVVRTGMAEHEKRLHVVALNLARRHLTDAQKVIVGRLIEPDAAEAAKARMSEGARSGQVSGPSESRDDVASRVGLGSGRTYERGRKVLEKAEAIAPDVANRMSTGDLTVREAAKELRQAAKALRVEEIAATPVAEIPAEQTFPILLVDPPWRYEDAEPTRAIENHYPTMSAADLADMDVPAADDAVLFMWTTSPKLREAFALLDAWGFEYRTCLVWVKDRIGMGYYARQRHELLLVAKTGALPVPDPQNRPDSVIEAPRGVHSAKPDVVYELIERMYPGYRYCELFARATRDGWTSWGNQAGAAA